MPGTARDNRKSRWPMFAAGLGVGLASYLALRRPIETLDAVGRGLLYAEGGRFHAVPWRYGTLRFVTIGEGDEPMVIVHGVSDAPQSWALLLRSLGRRFRICLPVLPAHPGTDCPNPMTLDDCVEAVDVAMLRAFGGARAHLVGHSLGGWVSALFAAQASSRLHSLTLVNPGGLSRLENPGLIIPRTYDEARRQIRTMFGRRVPAPRFVLDAYRRGMEHRVSPCALDMLRDATILGEELVNISVPTRVVVGTRDVLINPDDSRRLAAMIPGAVVEAIEGGTHNPHLTDIGELSKILRETPAIDRPRLD